MVRSAKRMGHGSSERPIGKFVYVIHPKGQVVGFRVTSGTKRQHREAEKEWSEASFSHKQCYVGKQAVCRRADGLGSGEATGEFRFGASGDAIQKTLR